MSKLPQLFCHGSPGLEMVNGWLRRRSWGRGGGAAGAGGPGAAAGGYIPAAADGRGAF